MKKILLLILLMLFGWAPSSYAKTYYGNSGDSVYFIPRNIGTQGGVSVTTYLSDEGLRAAICPEIMKLSREVSGTSGPGIKGLGPPIFTRACGIYSLHEVLTKNPAGQTKEDESAATPYYNSFTDEWAFAWAVPHDLSAYAGGNYIVIAEDKAGVTAWGYTGDAGPQSMGGGDLSPGGDMETGAGDPWTPTGWTNTGWAGETTQHSADKHGGTYSVWVNSGIGHGLTLWRPIYMSLGSSYKIGFWLKDKAPIKGDINCKIYTDGVVSGSNYIAAGGNTDWTYHEINITPTFNGGNARINFLPKNTANGMSFLIDDVVVSGVTGCDGTGVKIIDAAGDQNWEYVGAGFDYDTVSGFQVETVKPNISSDTYYVYSGDNTIPYASVGGRTYIQMQAGTTNNVLHSRDGSNVVWNKTNCTAVRNAIGITNDANTGTSVTATAANATIFQTVTKSAEDHTFSIFLKRLVGTGGVSITMDGGTNYYDVTANLSTSAWYTGVTTQGQVNPVIGFRMETSGECILFDMAQLEEGKVQHMPIPTIASVVTTEKDELKFAMNGLDNLFAESLGSEQWEDGTDPYFVDKSTLNLEDVYANPGVSLVDSGKTNFQGGTGDWDTKGTNNLYTVLDAGVSVLAIEYIDHQAGADADFLAIESLISDLTVGKLYIFTALIKLNTGSVQSRIVRQTGDPVYTRNIVETAWTGISAYFIASDPTQDAGAFYGLSAGETIYVKEWDLRELDSRSVLGDEEGDPELQIDGSMTLNTTSWNQGVNWLISGTSAAHTPGSTDRIRTQVGYTPLSTSGLYQITYEVSNRTTGNVRSSIVSGTMWTYGAWVGSNGSQTDYLYYIANADQHIKIHPDTNFDGIVDNFSVKKINTAWTPYDANTLALSTDSGISVTYVDNGSGASIFLTDIDDLATTPTSGKAQKFTCNARISTGDCVLHIRAQDGTSKAQWTISDTDSEAISLYFTSGASDYIDFSGLAATEEVWVDDLGLVEVTNSPDDQGPPVGTFLVNLRAGMDMDDVAAFFGVISPDTNANNGIYISSAGRFAGYDGTTAIYEADSGVSNEAIVNVAMRYGEITNGVAQFEIGVDAGSGISWGTAGNWDGAFTNDWLSFLVDLEGVWYLGSAMIWDEVKSDELINTLY